MDKREPKVKDIIRYNEGGEWRPAIVSQVHNSESINLQFLSASGSASWATSVTRGDGDGKWDFVA